MGWYEETEQVYRERYGEDLVADAGWVEPLFDQCECAVRQGGEYGPDADPSVWWREILERTCDVIATMTYGVTQAQGMRDAAAAKVPS